MGKSLKEELKEREDEYESGSSTLLERIRKTVQGIQERTLLRYLTSAGAGVVAGISAMQARAEPLGNAFPVDLNGRGQLQVHLYDTTNIGKARIAFPVPEPGHPAINDISEFVAQFSDKGSGIEADIVSDPKSVPEASQPDVYEWTYVEVLDEDGQIVKVIFTQGSPQLKKNGLDWTCDMLKFSVESLGTSGKKGTILLSMDPNGPAGQDIFELKLTSPSCEDAVRHPDFSTRGTDLLAQETEDGDMAIVERPNGIYLYERDPTTGAYRNVIIDEQTGKLVPSGFFLPGIPEPKFNRTDIQSGGAYRPALKKIPLENGKIVTVLFFLRNVGDDENRRFKIFWHVLKVEDDPDGDGVPAPKDTCSKYNPPDQNGVQPMESCNPPPELSEGEQDLYWNSGSGISVERNEKGEITKVTMTRIGDDFMKTQANRTLELIRILVPKEALPIPSPGMKHVIDIILQVREGTAGGVTEGEEKTFTIEPGEEFLITHVHTQFRVTLQKREIPDEKQDGGLPDGEGDSDSGTTDGNKDADGDSGGDDGSDHSDAGPTDTTPDTHSDASPNSPPPEGKPCGDCETTGKSTGGILALVLGFLGLQKLSRLRRREPNNNVVQ